MHQLVIQNFDNTNLVVKTLMYLQFLHDHVCELVVLPLVFIQHIDFGRLVQEGAVLNVQSQRVQRVLDGAVHMGTNGVVQDR